MPTGKRVTSSRYYQRRITYGHPHFCLLRAPHTLRPPNIDIAILTFVVAPPRDGHRLPDLIVIAAYNAIIRSVIYSHHIYEVECEVTTKLSAREDT
jgi:hypothetical protein